MTQIDGEVSSQTVDYGRNHAYEVRDLAEPITHLGGCVVVDVEVRPRELAEPHLGDRHVLGAQKLVEKGAWLRSVVVDHLASAPASLPTISSTLILARFTEPGGR